MDLPWCAAVVAEIEAPSPIGSLLFVHHKPTYEFGYGYERELQAVICARFVEEQLAGRQLHVVLAGDFDDTPGSASVRYWAGEQSLQRSSVAFDEAVDGVWASDHFAVVADLFAPEYPPGAWRS